MPGIVRSRSTSSGLSSRASSIASSPSLACPTTSKPCCSRSDESASRVSGWSSTSKMRSVTQVLSAATVLPMRGKVHPPARPEAYRSWLVGELVLIAALSSWHARPLGDAIDSTDMPFPRPVSRSTPRWQSSPPSSRCLRRSAFSSAAARSICSSRRASLPRAWVRSRSRSCPTFGADAAQCGRRLGLGRGQPGRDGPDCRRPVRGSPVHASLAGADGFGRDHRPRAHRALGRGRGVQRDSGLYRGRRRRSRSSSRPPMRSSRS